MIHHYNYETLVDLVLFTVPFYHFLFSKYLELAERHFSSDILVPFPESGVLYSRGPSMVFHDIDMNIFSPASFVKFPWHYWTEFSQSWKDLTKTLRSHGNLQSLTDLINGANIGTHSNSRDWLFWMFMMSKINPLMNKRMLFLKDV